MSRSFSDKHKAKKGARFQFEHLEPRHLFSADPLTLSPLDAPPTETSSAVPLLGEQTNQELTNFTWLPMVFAGASKTVAVSTSLLLTGEVIVNASDNLSVLWSKISGPGNAVFGSALSVGSSVIFDQPGTYELQLAATNHGILGSARLTVTVTGATPLPEYDLWTQDMLKFGRQHGEWLLAHQNDAGIGLTYYDAARVFYQIADYTGDATWNTYAEAAAKIYRDFYVIPNNGGVPGYWNFSRGLVMHYERTGDTASRDAAILLSNKAAYAGDATPLSWTESYETSREVAYAIMSYLDSERVGAPRRARLEALEEQALGHLDQWFIQESDSAYAPFMFGLTADALMQYYERVDPNPRIIEKLAAGANWTWQNAWMPAEGAFYYRADNTSLAAPDLNLLIAPVYEWLFQKTGDAKYRTQSDQIFSGGVKGAWLSGAKQFNQNYRVSFEFVALRLSKPISQANTLEAAVFKSAAGISDPLDPGCARIGDYFARNTSDPKLKKSPLPVVPSAESTSLFELPPRTTSVGSHRKLLAEAKEHTTSDFTWSDLADLSMCSIFRGGLH